MKYSIFYTIVGSAIVEAENEVGAVERLRKMNLAQIGEISDGNLFFLDSIEEERDE